LKLSTLTIVESNLRVSKLKHYEHLPHQVAYSKTFTVAKHDTTSTNGASDLSISWTCSLKQPEMTANILMSNRVRSENFQKTFQNNSWLVDGHEEW